MTRGRGRKDMIVAKVRPGLKREFEFAFRAHSEVYEPSGRTRSCRSRNSSSHDMKRVRKSSRHKKLKITSKICNDEMDSFDGSETVREDEDSSDVVELGIGDEEAKIGMIESIPISGKIECAIGDNSMCSLNAETSSERNGHDDVMMDMESDDPANEHNENVNDGMESTAISDETKPSITDTEDNNNTVHLMNETDVVCNGEAANAPYVMEGAGNGVYEPDGASLGGVKVSLDAEENEVDGSISGNMGMAGGREGGDSKLGMEKNNHDIDGSGDIYKNDNEDISGTGVDSVYQKSGKGKENMELEEQEGVNALPKTDNELGTCNSDSVAERKRVSLCELQHSVCNNNGMDDDFKTFASELKPKLVNSSCDPCAKPIEDRIHSSEEIKKNSVSTRPVVIREYKRRNICKSASHPNTLNSMENSSNRLAISILKLKPEKSSDGTSSVNHEPVEVDGVQSNKTLKSDDTDTVNEKKGTLCFSPRSSLKVEHSIGEKTVRRFTRSLLKPKPEVSEITNTQVVFNTSSNKLNMTQCDAGSEDWINASERVSESVICPVQCEASVANQNGSGLFMERFNGLGAVQCEVLVDREGGASSSASGGTPAGMSRKDASKTFPKKLKDLLDSGILEGERVKYIRGSKVRIPGDAGLHGIIQGSGIICFCQRCQGMEVVTPTIFELHAGSANKRPPEYIYLENGNTLRDVMNACRTASAETLDETVRLSIGCSSLRKSSFCLKCRGPVTENGIMESKLLCNYCYGSGESTCCLERKTSWNKRAAQTLPSTKSSDQETKLSSSSIKFLLPRPSPGPTKHTPPSIKALVPKLPEKSMTQSLKSQGRLTRKDLRLHKLVFEDDILPDGTEVAYYARGQKLLVGYKMGFGIFCSCCNTEISPSQFEAHAGWASRRKPYLHIYTSNGVSLHELAISLSKGRKFPSNENDDLCQICKGGGDLLCCDGCPRAFHPECISQPSDLSDIWYCKFCLNNYQKEKFVEHNANAIAAGRIEGVDPIEQITNRCIRIAKSFETEFGGCVLCRNQDFDRSFGARTVILCDQCEKEFHVGCLREHKIQDLKELPEGEWFCCRECEIIHTALMKLVIHGEEKLPEFCLDVFKRKHEGAINSEYYAGLDIRWRLLSERIDASDDVAVLLSEAVTIFHERFDPIVLASKGRDGNRDLIPPMVYGRNIRGQDFGGMYCAVLLVNQVVVSCAIVRIFGQELAELPLVATSNKAQGQGFFHLLYSCVEKLLGFLSVKNLVLPATEEAHSIWTNKFGFKKLTEDEVVGYRKDYQMMGFQGASMLQKRVPRCRIVNRR